ncbi:MAG: hypothetical protein Kow0031_04900 [Anaerolineae bacterium]
MSEEIFKAVVVTLGPLVIYVTVMGVMQIPEMITALPATVRRAMETTGALLIIAAWLSIGSLGGALALLGLLLLAAPAAARLLTEIASA